MRTLILAAAALASAPAAAQDHSGHAHGAAEPQDSADVQERAAGAQADHQAMDHGSMDHSGMDHGADGRQSMDHDEMDHEAMDHGAMDHGSMGHGTMDHGSMHHSGHGAMADQPMDHSGMDHSMMDHSAMDDTPALPASGPPPRAFVGPEHAADVIYGSEAMAPARRQLVRENGDFSGSMLMLERLEARVGKGTDAYLWDAQGWTGGDIDKLWIKSEGEGTFGGDTGGGSVEDAEVQALWSHAIGPWFDLQAGARHDFEPAGRTHAVLGVQGLAPYMFEVDAAAFLSDRGDLTARVEAEYDQRITQRLILQPRAEIALSAQDIPEIGTGSGMSAIEAGLRLRYEIRREFAPYVGVGYSARLGRTADYARAASEDSDALAALIGLRAWF